MVVYENKNIDSELIIKDTKANPSLAKNIAEYVDEKMREVQDELSKIGRAHV